MSLKRIIHVIQYHLIQTIMKVPAIFFTLTLANSLSGQTVLISPTIRNGGFEDTNSNDFAGTPFWDSYFAEGAGEDPTLNFRTNTGSLRSFVNGFQGSGIRIHPTQTIPSTDWDIQAGDIFTIRFFASTSSGLDRPEDEMQAILHIVDASGNLVSDPTLPYGFADRLFSSTTPFTDTGYLEFNFTSNPVPSGSPWIGNQVQLRLLNTGDRNEYALLDDVSLTAYRESEANEPATLQAFYQAEENAIDAEGGDHNATPLSGLTYESGFGTGSAFATDTGGLVVPASYTGSFSIAFWVKANGTGQTGTTYSWTDGSPLIDGSPSFGVSLRGSKIALGSSQDRLFSQTLISNGNWHHVAITYSALIGRIQLYIDGKLEDVALASSPLPAISDLLAGSFRDASSQFDGLIDNLRVYQGILTSNEVNALHLPPGDSDGDGASNSDEEIAGTAWGDAKEKLVVESVSAQNGILETTVEGKRSRAYQLLRYNSLPPSEPSVAVDTEPTLSSDQAISLSDQNPPANEAYYQVAATKSPAARPNILMIVGDDHGYADISAYPNARPDISTPNLDRIATSGTIFTQAYVTSPVCSPSRAGFLTGRYQNDWDPTGGWAPRLPANIKHVAEYLSEAGYATAMIGKNDLGQPTGSTNNRELPTNHGFEQFFGFNAHAHDFWLHSQEITDTVSPAWPTEASAHLGQFINTELPEIFETQPDGKWQTELFTDRAIDYLQGRVNQPDPFFLFLSHASVHALIHQAPASYLADEGVPELPVYDPTTDVPGNPATYTSYYYQYSRPNPQVANGIIADADMRKYYRAHLHAFDDQIGRVLDSLSSTGLADNTLVIYFSDNGGEALTGANNQPLSGSKYTVFEGGLRVPLMMSWPGHIPAGQVYSPIASTLDVVPTLLECAGIENAVPLDGHSLLKPLANNDPVLPEDRTLFWRFNTFWAIRRGDWKLVFSGKSLASAATSEITFNEAAIEKVALFNLANDPGESTDLAESTDPAIQTIKSQLQALFDAWDQSN